MFLQRYKLSHQMDYVSSQQQLTSTIRVGQLLKKITPVQIKQHMKKNIYINPRTSLIQNTKNLIRSSQELNQLPKDTDQKHKFIFTSEHHNKSKFNRNYAQMSNRQTRIAAAKKIRQRIWKSSDITPIIKAHEQTMLRKKTNNYHSIYGKGQNKQKIHRYQDSMMFEQSHFSRRIIEGTKNNYKSYRKNTDKIQTTNMQFGQQSEQSTPFNLGNLQIGKDLQHHKHHHSVLASGEKRSNTTRKIKRSRMEDNFIEPW